MKKLFLLAMFALGCEKEPCATGIDADTPDASADAHVKSDARIACEQVIAARDRLIARCPGSLHGVYAECARVTGLLRPEALPGCIRFHDNVPCAPGQILWHPECTDMFTVDFSE